MLACIRRSGEFGSHWHQARRSRFKAHLHADIAAVAADLVRHGVTRPVRIAAEGAFMLIVTPASPGTSARYSASSHPRTCVVI